MLFKHCTKAQIHQAFKNIPNFKYQNSPTAVIVWAADIHRNSFVASPTFTSKEKLDIHMG